MACTALLALATSELRAADAVASPAPPVLMPELGSHSAAVRRLDASAALGLVVTASDDRAARVWDLASGELRQVLRPLAFGAEGGRLYGAAIHPREKWVALGGATGDATHPHRVYLFDLGSGTLLRTIDVRYGDVRRLAWSADGTVLMAGYTGRNGWSAFAVDGRLLYDEARGAPVYAIAAAANGQVAVASLDGDLRNYRVAADKVEPGPAIALGARRSVGLAFSPDGRQLAVAGLGSRDVDMFDAASGSLLGRLASGLSLGELRSLAWSADGRSLYAAGSTYRSLPAFPILRFDVAARRLAAEIAAAHDSINDLLALPGGELLFASVDGTWGVVGADDKPRRFGAGIRHVVEPDDLALAADARSLRWGASSGAVPFDFSFTRRSLQTASAPNEALRKPETRFGLLDAPSNWSRSANQAPRIGGNAVAMAPDEASRALVVLRNDHAAVLGTNRALYRYTDHGELVWRRATDTQVDAVNASADGKLLVSAMADGSVRWWRAADGTPLLTLLATADGRWVAWTPSGYFDASAGADSLVGWALARSDAPTMDFYSLGRFRARYNRPDVIDAVLSTLDEKLALASLASRDEREREAAGRELAEREQAALEAARQAAAKAEAARLAAEREAAARGAAETARREADAAEQARAEEAAEASARQTAQAAKEREEAQRLAAAQQEAARIAQQESAERESLARERLRRDEIAAIAFPPALSSTAAKRMKLGNESEVSLPFSIDAGGAGAELAMQIRINGRPAQPLALNAPKAADGTMRGNVRVKLDEPLSVVEIIASNASGASEPLSFQVEREMLSGPRPEGNLYVLAIGVADYARSEYRLGLPAKDAADFAAAMKAQEGRQYRHVEVRSLLDHDATRASITREFEWLKTTVGPNDVAMLFVAGHGVNDSAGRYFFLPYDGQLEHLAGSAISQASIVTTLSRIRGRTLFFVDTCFAGNTLGALRQASRETERMMNELGAAENGVVVFASSTGQEESEERSEWGNGAFTKALLEGLGGKADFMNVGRVTFSALNLFVSEEVRRITEGRQRPVFISPRGVPDFALARK